MADRFHCPCGAEWGGLATCHCSGCHETFTGITSFDKHQPNSRNCVPPVKVGLVMVTDRPYPCWGSAPGGGVRVPPVQSGRAGKRSRTGSTQTESK